MRAQAPRSSTLEPCIHEMSPELCSFCNPPDKSWNHYLRELEKQEPALTGAADTDH